MPTYTFYPRLPDDHCLTFAIADLVDDVQAISYAESVLLDHSSAVEVTAWDGQRVVGHVRAGTSPSFTEGKKLHGCSVLVLEDRYLQAEDLRKLLVHAGARVIGPYADARTALDKVEQQRPSCALLDINLGDGADFSPSEALLARGVPVVFLTGYDAPMIPSELSRIPHLVKPASAEAIVQTLARLCVSARREACVAS